MPAITLPITLRRRQSPGRALRGTLVPLVLSIAGLAFAFSVIRHGQGPSPHYQLSLPAAPQSKLPETPEGRPVPATPRVVLVEPVRSPGSAAAARQARVCFERTAELLRLAGVPFAKARDTALSADALKGYSVAVLPFNALTDQNVESLRAFAAAGGKLLAMYPQAPAGLFELLGTSCAGARGPAFSREFGRISFPAPASEWALPDGFDQDASRALALTPAPGTEVIGLWGGKGQRAPAVTLNEAGMLVGYFLTADDKRTKRFFLLGALARLDPAVWGQSARTLRARALNRVATEEARWEKARRRPGVAGQEGSVRRFFDETRRSLGEVAQFPPSDRSHGQAAYESAFRADHLLDCVEGAMVPAPKGEIRGFWIHTYSPTDWDAVMAKAKAGGMNAVFVRVGRGGNVIYPGSPLPEDAWAVQAGGDELQKAIDAAHKYGLAFHAWRVLYHMGSAPEEFQKQMAAEDRLVRNPKGEQTRPAWANPADPRNQDLELQVMKDLVSRYNIDGLHLDYIRYPDEPSFNFDYGPVSRREFEQAARLKVRRWPVDVISGSLRARYESWQCWNITQLVHRVSQQTKALKPKVQLSAAVWYNYPGCVRTVRQEWPGWVRAGWLDFVVPMTYVMTPEKQGEMVRQQIGLIARKRPLLAGIGNWQLQSPLDTLAQVRAARAAGARGFVLFSYNDDQIGDILDVLGAGVR